MSPIQYLSHRCSKWRIIDRSIVEHNPAFAKVYLEEKRLLIREAFADMDGEIFLQTCRQLRWGEQHLARLYSKE